MSNFAQKFAKMSPSEQRLFLDDPSTKAKTGELTKLYKILTNFDFITAKINHDEFGVQALIGDYDLMNDAKVVSEDNLETVKALKLVQGALRLSAHILNEDKTQLAEQLTGRLLPFKASEILTLLEQAKQNKTTWLRPLTPSLTPPGGGLIRTLCGHSFGVNAVAVIDSEHVISASRDKTLKVWNWQTGEEVRTLTGHSSSVNAVAVIDSEHVISASGDDTLKVWNWQTGKKVRTLTGHRDWVRAVAVIDSEHVISASDDKTLKVWNWQTGKKVRTLTGHRDWVRAFRLTPILKLKLGVLNA
ncbi:hypothetical protein NUACC21_36340 [Scytonema sp. NUACC21]